MKKRERILEENCPKCGALSGDRCRNFKGGKKMPCKLEVTAEDEEYERLAKSVQRGLFDQLS